MPLLPHVAISALLRHYERQLAADPAVGATLRAVGLVGNDRRPAVALGLADRTGARVLGGLTAATAREWRTAWRDAGLHRPDGRERFVGCLITPLRCLAAPGLALASLPLRAVQAPQGVEVPSPVPGIALLLPTRARRSAALFACSDPFDAAVLRAIGLPAGAVVAGPVVGDAEIVRLSAALARLRPHRLRLLCAATAAGDRASEVWRTAADAAGIVVEATALPAGCTLRTLRHLGGPARVEDLIAGRLAHRPHAMATVPRPAPSRLPWAASATPLAADLSAYVAQLGARGQSPVECQRRALALGYLWACCRASSVSTTASLGTPLLEHFQSELVTSATGAVPTRSVGAAIRILAATRGFLTWALRTGRLRRDLAATLVPVPRPSVPPPLVLSAGDVERALAGIATCHATGLRDRAMLDLLYGTGIRRAELVGLDVGDIDWTRGVVRVRRGKGNRSRLVPLGRRAAAWLRAYVDRARPAHLTDVEETALFLSRRGRRIGVKTVTARMHARLRAAGITKGGSCHIIRHSVATLMHDGGADIRDLQALLGHALLTSTQLYTRVSLQRLQEVHRRTHPAEQEAASPREIANLRRGR